MKKLLILSVLFTGAAFGQSGIFNVPYKTQPRILIPHVEPPIFEGLTSVRNSLASLKYCDFVIKAIDQASTNSDPIVYIFSSSGGVEHPNLDTDGTVFYQNVSLPWPDNVKRIENHLYPVTNLVMTAVDWNDPEVLLVMHPASVRLPRYELYGIEAPFNGIGPEGFPNYQWYSTDGKRQAYYYSSDGITWELQSYDADTGQDNDTFFSFTSGLYSQPAPVYQPLPVVSLSGSVMESSENNAVAVEFYPSKKPEWVHWMKPGNPNIKWMCVLSNGVDFYRDLSGNPVWFNCDVEWVDVVPVAGALIN